MRCLEMEHNMANTGSRYQRMYAVTVDKFGIDPIQDKIIPHIQAIRTYTTHEITQDERGAPDLISLNAYGSDEYWWIILAYNGIGSYKLLVEGTTLKIPDLASVINVVNSNAIRPHKVQRTIKL